jgi:hypothetical protein
MYEQTKIGRYALHVCACMNILLHVHSHTHACMYVCVCICMYVCMYACMYVCVCVYACMNECMCAFMRQVKIKYQAAHHHQTCVYKVTGTQTVTYWHKNTLFLLGRYPGIALAAPPAA